MLQFDPEFQNNVVKLRTLINKIDDKVGLFETEMNGLEINVAADSIRGPVYGCASNRKKFGVGFFDTDNQILYYYHECNIAQKILIWKALPELRDIATKTVELCIKEML